MDRFTKSGKKLADVIKKAIHDHVITNDEFDEIMHAAHADGHIDPMEERVLKELHAMIADGTVKRVADTSD